MDNRNFESKYGHFSEDGRSYRITRPDTPRPWVNVIANERYGLVLSQAGGGFSWVDHSALSVLTRWEMDLVRDAWGKWLYLRDEDSGALWSAAPQPCGTQGEEGYECRHGMGYSSVSRCVGGIATEWTLTVPPTVDGLSPTHELWRLRLENRSPGPRRITAGSAFLWCLGSAPDSKREFHRLFIDNRFHAAEGMITATKNLWEVPDEAHGHWNTEWPHTAFHGLRVAGCAGAPEGLVAAGDYAEFLGRHGDWENPAWLGDAGRKTTGFSRHSDAMAALALPLTLEPGQRVDLHFVLGVADSTDAAREVLAGLGDASCFDATLVAVGEAWARLLEPVEVETPDGAFDLLCNHWLPYQAIAARLWGRTGYWQQSGAFGFRDQLQDSQVYLPQAPERCRAQLRLHARHQFADGTVYHWWHPLSEVGLRTEMTDDLLWLPFVAANYLKETGNFAALEDAEPFVDDAAPVSLWEHGRRAIEKVLERRSPRGLPLIGAGDWNDGMSACGLAGRGESVWLGHFLHGILRDWARLARLRGDAEQAEAWLAEAAALREAVNRHGWDGRWYLRATLDDGSPLGTADADEARIFLNAQTWAVLAGTADPDRAAQAMDAVEEQLALDYGPILFRPAFSTPDARVGYLTRYAPGARENGGLYTHAGVWAIQAACRLGRAELAWRLFRSMAPPWRGLDPDHYQVEPYVTPGNVEGPDSPHFGRGGWTWYTGSAAWLRRICLEEILGVRPDWDGLRLRPCLPSHWPRARLLRPWRGDLLDIAIENPEAAAGGTCEILVDGRSFDAGEALAPSGENRRREIRITVRAGSPEPVAGG